MKQNNTHDMVLAALLSAVGIVLPFVTSHTFGIPGTTLLPMHLPVFLTGIFCGPVYGAICGALVPILSSFLTGMPSPFPMAPIMTGELFTYGLVSGLCTRKLRLPVYPSIIAAMLCGRFVYGLIFSSLLTANGGTLRALTVSAAVIDGIPGIILQLILIPAIVTMARRRGLSRDMSDARDDSAMESAKKMIADGDATFIVIRNGEIIHTADGRGVRPIMQLLDSKPELLRGSVIVDKIIGKAAALLLKLGDAKRVYGELMSARARDYLQTNQMRPEYGRCIDVISNRAGDGICPLERAVCDTDDPVRGREILRETIKQLMSKAG